MSWKRTKIRENRKLLKFDEKYTFCTCLKHISIKEKIEIGVEERND